MSTDLHDLRRVLTDRAATSPAEVAAARDRLDTVLTTAAGQQRRTRPEQSGRRTRVLAVAAVAVAVVALVGSVVASISTTSEPRSENFAAGLAEGLAMTDWLFTVRTEALPDDLDVVQYGHADRDRQVAFLLRPGDAATSNRFTGSVTLSVGGVDRPRDATSDDGGWYARSPSNEWGVSGWQVVWTDHAAGYTLRAVAPDLATARTLRAATDVGATHPVRFPVAFTAGALPAGSRVQSVEFTGVEGIRAVVDVPGSPPWQLSAAAPGVYLGNVRSGNPSTTVTPLAAGFSRVRGDAPDASSAVLTAAGVDLELVIGDPGEPTRPAVDDAELRALVTGARFAPFALHPDQDAWFPLAESLPTG